jgi:hypothetical protein
VKNRFRFSTKQIEYISLGFACGFAWGEQWGFVLALLVMLFKQIGTVKLDWAPDSPWKI